MKRYIRFVCLLLSVVFFSCSAGELISPNYYVLEYYSHSEKEILYQKTPIDIAVFVLDTKIPRTYGKSQIVVRHFGPRITYSDYDMWGVKLSKIIPDLITKRINNYNLFKSAQREYLTARPEYEISTTINNIELYKSETIHQARLNMDFKLRKSGEQSSIVEYSTNIEKVLLAEDVDTFVQTINDMILEETDNFVRKIILHFVLGKDEDIPPIKLAEGVVTSMLEIIDEDIVGEGKGLLLLPAITRTENEPVYKIIDKYGYEQSGKMGTPIPLLEGTYKIVYGSGKLNQWITKENVKIIPRYKTIVEPNWGCLIVGVIDEKRNFAKIRYEVFDLENGDSYGSEFPAEEEVGEQEKVWILKPGYYKVTINNEPFNTYTDFTTVLIEEGKVQKLTIVVNTDEDGNPTNLAGAGILEESFLERTSGNLKFSSSIYANFNVNSNNEVDKDNPETTITTNAQLNNYLIYDKEPVFYKMKNYIEVGTSKTTDTDFRLAADEFDLKNTFIYYFLKDFGFYGRFDLNTHFFRENNFSSSEFYYKKIDNNNYTIEDSVLTDEVEVKSPLYPLVMKEGTGINYRMLNSAKADLNFRAGFGMRQEMNNDYYQLVSDSTWTDSLQIEHRTYNEMESESKTGIELSIEGDFQLPLNLTYSTNADFLFPFSKEDDYSMEWENIINLKLFKYISLDYKLTFKNKQLEIGDDYIVTKHSLFLRITYFLK
ncbi:MAG: PqiC family protein [Candidatus Cloacimonetes bacterium]|nr:PqiC family protein [Candidatus Cloacimonadota bacterium]